MSVVIVYGSGMFCDNQCQDDNGAGIIADVQIKWRRIPDAVQQSLTQASEVEREGKRNVQRNAQKEKRNLNRYGKAVAGVQSTWCACRERR